MEAKLSGNIHRKVYGFLLFIHDVLCWLTQLGKTLFAGILQTILQKTVLKNFDICLVFES